MVHPLKNVKWLNTDSTKKLYFLSGINREITPNQVTKLCKSVKKMGIIRPVLVVSISFIDGVKRTYILDGQHLFTALTRLIKEEENFYII
jgi:ParB-like chromosome segregation protein Spo0J